MGALLDLGFAYTQDNIGRLACQLEDMEIPSIVTAQRFAAIEPRGNVALDTAPDTPRPEQMAAALDAAARIIWQHLIPQPSAGLTPASGSQDR